MLAAEKEFGVEEGRTLIMAALESPKGVLNAYEIASASDRLFGIALSAGDFHRSMHTHYVPGGIELNTARNLIVMSARAAGVQCFDTVFTNLDDEEGFENEVRMIHDMGFDGKSLINPRQIAFVHQTLAPTPKEIATAETYVRTYEEQSKLGVGVYTVNGKMVDIAFIKDASRVIALAKACGVYHGDL